MNDGFSQLLPKFPIPRHVPPRSRHCDMRSINKNFIIVSFFAFNIVIYHISVLNNSSNQSLVQRTRKHTLDNTNYPSEILNLVFISKIDLEFDVKVCDDVNTFSMTKTVLITAIQQPNYPKSFHYVSGLAQVKGSYLGFP